MKHIIMIALLAGLTLLLGCWRSSSTGDGPAQDVNIDSNSDTDTDTDADADVDTDTDTDSDSDAETETDPYVDTDSYTAWDAFIDCEGGKLDPHTSLCWQDPATWTVMSWDETEAYCGSLGAGWRIPSIDELRSLIVGCPDIEPNGGCGVTDPDCLDYNCRLGCDNCDGGGGLDDDPPGCYWNPSLSGPCNVQWTSSPTTDLSAEHYWFLNFMNTEIDSESGDAHFRVRCVRPE